MHLNKFHTSDTSSWKLCTLHFKTVPLRGRIGLRITLVNRKAELFLMWLRDTNGDSLSNDHSVEKMDWKRFDLDKEYAWGHLKHCMTVILVQMQSKNKIQRFRWSHLWIEYSLTRRHMLMWVLHSYGTQDPSSNQASTTLPSMFSH